MSADRDITRVIQSWVHEDANENADRVLDLVLDQIDTTPQRRAGWLARRLPTMNRPLQIALVGVAAVAIALLGSQLLPRSNTGVLPTATPIPTAAPSPVAFSSYSSSAPNHNLPAGRVVLDGAFPLTVTFKIPAGRSWEGDWETAGRATIHKARGDAAPVSVDLFVVDNVYADPCHPAAGPLVPTLGPTVADFAAAVRAWNGFHVTNRADATLGGRPATSFVLTNQIDTATCDGKPWLQQWTHAGGGDDSGAFGILAKTTEQIWALDVDGTRLVILVSTYGDETASDLAEARAIVDSIRFE